MMGDVAPRTSYRLPGADPRWELRVPLPVLVQSAGQWRAGRLRNLSRGGAFITLDADVWVGEELKVILGLPPVAGGRLELRALAVWRTICEEPGRAAVTAGYGLLFPAQPQAEKALPRAIEALQASGMVRPNGRPPAPSAPEAPSAGARA